MCRVGGAIPEGLQPLLRLLHLLLGDGNVLEALRPVLLHPLCCLCHRRRRHCAGQSDKKAGCIIIRVCCMQMINILALAASMRDHSKRHAYMTLAPKRAKRWLHCLAATQMKMPAVSMRTAVIDLLEASARQVPTLRTWNDKTCMSEWRRMPVQLYHHLGQRSVPLG